MIELRIKNIQKRIESADQEIRKIRRLKEKVVEDMAPAVRANLSGDAAKDYVYIELLQLRTMNIDKRIEAVDEEIKKIRELKEKVVEDMAPVMPANAKKMA